MRLRSTAVFAVMLTLTRVAAAQSVGKMLVDDWKSAGKDVLAIWGSPFDASGRDWLLTGAAFGAFGVSMLADQSVSDWAIKNKNSSGFRAIDPVRRGGVLFSGKYVVPPIAASYIAGVVLKNQDLRDFVTGCAASWASQSFLRKGLYALVGRARPDTMPNDPQHWTFPGESDEWQLHSFPAGHFANAMACATYWNTRFKMGVVEPALYLVAAAVGVGRLADEAHWTSDTVIGGILGYAVGREIARRSLARHAAGGVNRTTSSLYMTPEPGGLSMGMRWSF